MKIIQHRANSLHTKAHVSYAEIDVHITSNGQCVIKHGPEDISINLNTYLEKSLYEKYFIDIKQNLDTVYLKLILSAFDQKAIGLFDVPMPSAYYACKANLPIYGRLSEFEPVNFLFGGFWVDPLANWHPITYGNLIAQTRLNHKLIIAAPSLHGHNVSKDIEVARFIKYIKRVEGFVTKFPKEVYESLSF